MVALVDAETLGHRFRVVDPSTYSYGDYEFRDELTTKADHWLGLTGHDVVLDVGASWGGWTMLALAQGAQVLAVEPADLAFDVLSENVRANGWSWRARLVQAVLSTSEKPWSATHERDILTRNFPTSPGTRRMTLDQLVDEAGITSMTRVKMDVEGAEEDILRSGRATLARFRPLLVIEDHTADDAQHAAWIPELVGMRDRITAMLADYGYVTELTRPPTGNPFLIAHV